MNREVSTSSCEFDHTFRPDIFTASEQYAARFSGEVGKYFLEIQRHMLLQVLLKDRVKLRILEVGGGHAQLTQCLLELGHEVVVHGSDETCFNRLTPLFESYRNQLTTLTSPLEIFQPEAGAYDVVLAFRLMAHVRDWRDFLGRIAHGASKQVIVDIASLASFSILTPMLFPLKKLLEGNTREYFCHFPREVKSFVKEQGFETVTITKEFFFPMGFHRTLGREGWSRCLEDCARNLGLTALFGSPCIVSGMRV